MSDGTNGSAGLPDPSTIAANNPDPAGSIVSGSFNNNGGSAGDNGATGGGSAGTDTGTGSQGSNPGAPTQADYATLVKQFGTTAANSIMQTVAQQNPNWAGQIGQFVKGATSGSGTGTGGTTVNNSTGGPGTTDLMGLAAAGGLAYQQFNNAKQYTTQAEKYAGVLNPYGSYRDAAAQKLAALQADPSSIANTPGYQFALSQGLGAVANRDNRSFGVGAGSTNPDMMNYAQGLASKTYNDTINQYSAQAGVNIGPQSAANILGQGMQGNIASQNNAVNALMSPFGPGNNTGGSGSPGNNILNSIFGGATTPPVNFNVPTTNPDGTPVTNGGTSGDIPGNYTIPNITGGPNGTGFGSYNIDNNGSVNNSTVGPGTQGP